MTISTPEMLLLEAADRGTACTLSLPTQPVAMLRRSCVLQSDEQGIWFSLSPEDQLLIAGLISDGLPIHVSMRSKENDILFHAVPLAIQPNFITQSKRCVSAMLLKTPERISTSQRRSTFRVPILDVDGVSIRIWRINEYVLMRDRVLPSQELPCVPKDLGEGGFAATVYPLSDEALNLKFNQRFRVELRCGKHEMLFEARLRHPESTHRDDASANCGFELMHNDRDVESRRHRQKLQIVLSEVQRNSFRRGNQ